MARFEVKGGCCWRASVVTGEVVGSGVAGERMLEFEEEEEDMLTTRKC